MNKVPVASVTSNAATARFLFVTFIENLFMLLSSLKNKLSLPFPVNSCIS
tara:strand:- start:316 stop:465 length:150 start_codon:yes stop_codon:yes gene_type:complete